MTPLRTYRELEGDDRSGLASQVAAQRARVAQRLAPVRHVVAVMSGKGGVGKSYLTAGLAVGVQESGGGPVGVLDADLHGPTAAALLHAVGPVRIADGAAHPVMTAPGVKVVSMEQFLDPDSPLRWREPETEGFVWRGALEAGVLREFLADIEWGSLELLLIDLPPGTATLGDLVELVPRLTGVVPVTIPSVESQRSVTRAMELARERGVRLLGVVENMSEYSCATCGSRPLFAGNAGALLAERFGVPLLGRVPFRAEVSDPGAPSRAPEGLPHEVITRFREVLDQ